MNEQIRAAKVRQAQADVQALLALLGELSRESQSLQGRPSVVTLV